jgi:hypothetical protein
LCLQEAGPGSESAAETETDTEAPARHVASLKPVKTRLDDAAPARSAQQQQQQQQGANTAQVTNTGVAMAMEVLAKAEERLKELHIQEERLKVRLFLFSDM